MMIDIDISKIGKNLKKGDDGIFYSKITSEISYPEDGNEKCMQIEDNSFWFNHRNNVIIRSVNKFSKNNFIFFDVGGGNGFVSKGLMDVGIQVILIEPGVNGAQNAVSRGVKTVICSTLENAGFDNSSIDAIGLFDVIEHIEKDAEFLRKIHEYLKTGGMVYITVPASNLLWSHEDAQAGHYRRYSLKAIKKLLLNTGFKIHYSTYIFSILPIPIFLFRTLPSRLGLIKRTNIIQKDKNEHEINSGLINKMLNNLWSWELNRIDKSKSIIFGSSCFIIGRKVN